MLLTLTCTPTGSPKPEPSMSTNVWKKKNQLLTDFNRKFWHPPPQVWHGSLHTYRPVWARGGSWRSWRSPGSGLTVTPVTLKMRYLHIIYMISFYIFYIIFNPRHKSLQLASQCYYFNHSGTSLWTFWNKHALSVIHPLINAEMPLNAAGLLQVLT